MKASAASYFIESGDCSLRNGMQAAAATDRNKINFPYIMTNTIIVLT